METVYKGSWSYIGTLSNNDVGLKDYKGDKSYSSEWEYIKKSVKDEVKGMSDEIPKWAVAVVEGKSVNDIRRATYSSRRLGYKLVEIRIDSLRPTSTPESKARMGVFVMQIADLLKDFSIATIRRGRDGGYLDDKKMDENSRLDLMEQVASKGFLWLDIEADTETSRLNEVIKIARENGSGIMMSHVLTMGHDKYKGDENRDSLADVHKIIAPVKNIWSLENSIKYLRSARKTLQGKPVLFQFIGPHSELFNTITPIFGNSLTFTGLENNKPEGEDSQRYLSNEDSLSIWRHLGINGPGKGEGWSVEGIPINEQTTYGLILGSQINESLETVALNVALGNKEMNTLCIPMKCGYEDIERWLSFLRTFNTVGAWVNKPLKGSVARNMDKLEGVASLIGSINTIVSRGGSLIGYDTIGAGIADVVERSISKKNARVGVLGTGSIGRSAAFEIHKRGYKTFISGNNQSITKQVVKKLGGGMGAISSNNINRMKGKVDVLVNTTPEGKNVGKKVDEQAIGVAEIARTLEPMVGIDVVYSPPGTPFLSSVESRGGETVKGTDVMIYQVARTFQLWTGTWPEIKGLRRAVEDSAPHIIRS